QKNELLEYHNKDMALLTAKDQESRTELLKTFENYLLNNSTTKPAAEQQVNNQKTVKNRSKKMPELTTIAIRDFRTRC
ncbi:hypothetical protein MMJ17_25545, partial [Bacillus spizizenii]|nr:hypothetical protein [Bacillus spizizenii]